MGHRTCYTCHEVGHLAKNYPHCVIRDTHISIVRGMGTTKGARDKVVEPTVVVMRLLSQLVVMISIMLY